MFFIYATGPVSNNSNNIAKYSNTDTSEVSARLRLDFARRLVKVMRFVHVTEGCKLVVSPIQQSGERFVQ